MARIVSIPPASNVEMDALIAAQAGDSFAVSDNIGITGRVLWRLIGAAFEPHRNLATMNAVAASTAAMNAVVASATAMNAVATSATAMNAIWASSTAWNIVRASNMAVGKFAAGRAGQNAALFADMNAVAASTTAMDAVAASATAMNAVAASAVALNRIIKVASASVAITSAIQSRRATIISTMNAAPALFTRHANQQLNVSTRNGNFDVANHTNTFIIPLSQHQAWSGNTYTLFSLANVAQIHRFVGNDATVSISTGVALRGLRVHRSSHSGQSDITTYDMYTAV